MILCERKKVSDKGRVVIPADYLKKIGIEPGKEVYITFDEESKEIKILPCYIN